MKKGYGSGWAIENIKDSNKIQIFNKDYNYIFKCKRTTQQNPLKNTKI